MLRFLTLASIVAAFAAGSSVPVLAEGRPEVGALTCGQATALVRQHGSMTLATGRHTYDRFMARAGSCPGAQSAVSASVRTRDVDACTIGYVCVND